MTSDAPASESSKQDSAAVVGGVPPRLTAFRDSRRETTMRARSAYDCAFFQRVAHGYNVRTALMRSSAIKLEESLKLLAEVSDLLRR